MKNKILKSTQPFFAATLITLGSSVPAFGVVSGWNAGNIIADGVFTNANSMTVNDITAFLRSKVPRCDTNGTQTSEYGGGTRAQWAQAKYDQSTFTCLKDYSENGKSSAQIIYDVSQKYQINPQVLIVLLQKEQGLVTDTWPLNVQYRTATGYGCPDTAPCDSQYYGLTNQLDWAAKMFRAIMNDSPTWYTPYELGNNYIRYSPDSSCGGSTVNIQNRATQALYNYTPYQPNQGALNADWGTATCGAYGNRNFYLYFTTWFGSTQTTYQSAKDNFSFERLVGETPSVMSGTGTLASSSATISADGVLHTFYYDDTSGTLKHAWSDENGWNSETLDGASATASGGVAANVGASVTGFFDNGKMKIFYRNLSVGTVRMGVYNTTAKTWSFMELPGATGVSKQATNLSDGITATPYANQTQLFYYDSTNGNLRHGWTNESGWHFENIDGDKGSVAGMDANLGLTPTTTVYNGQLQLFYYDSTNGNLRHGWTDAIRGWKFENIDGDKGSVARYDANVGVTPSVVTYGNQLQLFYYDSTNGNLRHAWSDTNGWRFENLDGDGQLPFKYSSNVGTKAVAKVFQSDLFVFYYDESSRLWRIAYTDESGWHSADLDGSPRSLSRTPSTTRGRLSVDIYGSSMQIFYQDYSNGLRHAWASR